MVYSTAGLHIPHLPEIYRKSPELGTSRYNGQNVGSRYRGVPLYSLCLDYTCTYKYIQYIIQISKLRWGKAWLYDINNSLGSNLHFFPVVKWLYPYSSVIWHTGKKARAKSQGERYYNTWHVIFIATPQHNQHTKALWCNTVISIHMHSLHLHNNSMYTVQQECIRKGWPIPILMRCWCKYSSPTHI